MDMNERLFLGIRSSATGMKWVDRLGLREANTALAIAQNYGIPDLVSRVMAGRGVGLEAAEEFLNPSIRSLMPDPLTLTDMKQAAVRIADAILRRENVAIFGDYDVDGACSSALLSRFLNAYDIRNVIYIPDRIFEGYGPNPDAMRELVAKGASLIVTVDCGTNSAVSIAAAKDAGADVVVLDHHQLGGALPEDAAAIVNPNREDDISEQGHLCAAGVVFMTLVQLARELRERATRISPSSRKVKIASLVCKWRLFQNPVLTYYMYAPLRFQNSHHFRRNLTVFNLGASLPATAESRQWHHN